MAILLSTTETIPGYSIKEYRGIAWASSARSKNIASDFAAVVKSLVGGRYARTRS